MKKFMICCLLPVLLMLTWASLAFAENCVAVPKTPEEQRQERLRDAEVQQKRRSMDQERAERNKAYHQEKAREKAAKDVEWACSSAQSKGTRMTDVLRACGEPLLRTQDVEGGGSVHDGHGSVSVSSADIWHYDRFRIRFFNGKVSRVFSE